MSLDFLSASNTDLSAVLWSFFGFGSNNEVIVDEIHVRYVAKDGLQGHGQFNLSRLDIH